MYYFPTRAVRTTKTEKKGMGFDKVPRELQGHFVKPHAVRTARTEKGDGGTFSNLLL